MMEVTAIFDIGKTNKKFFLLDEDFNEVHKEYVRFDEIPDDDGFLSENLPELIKWVLSTFQQASDNTKYNITHVNFSTYGASLVHLDEDHNIVTPFYNYLKPLPDNFEEKFLYDVGSREAFEFSTSSPYLGMLNSGLQLYYLKHYKPDLFKQIKYSVHFPQFLSSLFTGRLFSDFTSVGCHTGLWDYSKNRYAAWVYNEGLDGLLCPVVRSSIYYEKNESKIGIGLHDSSAALIPYVKANDDPFVLISTGTWSIFMNFFNKAPLTREELNLDCLNFLSPTGNPLKASRLFLGEQLRSTVKKLGEYFDVSYHGYKDLKWNPDHSDKRSSSGKLLFDLSLLSPERFGYQNGSEKNFARFTSFDEAVHQLFNELTDLQIDSLKLAIGNSEIKKIYIDGGFSSSEVFTKYLSRKLPEYQIHTSSFPLGSTLGAALMIKERGLPDDYFERVYKVQRVNE